MKHKQLFLEPAKMQDSLLLWEWRNEKAVRATSFNSKFISYRKHKQWLRKKLANPDSQIYIFFNQNEIPIGQVRLDIDQDRIAEVSISIDKIKRGQGYGIQGLKLACKAAFNCLNIKKIRARIKVNNTISLHIFRKIGFIDTRLQKFKNSKYLELFLNRNE